MKAIVVSRTGGPSVLEYVDVPTPSPRTGEVLVRADMIGVNRPETLARAGTYPWMPPLPFIPGIEMAGTVAATGDGVTEFAPGDKVFVSARELPYRAGCYAEYIAVPAPALVRLPADVDVLAAASLSSYQMAYHLLHTATRGIRGDSILVDAASGAIGSAAVQLAKLDGYSTVIALVGSEKKIDALRTFGADHAISTGGQVTAEVRTITGGRGVDLVLNATGGKAMTEQFALLAPLGLAVSFSQLSGPLEPDLLAQFDLAHSASAAHAHSGALRVFSAHTFDKLPEYRRASMEYLIDRLRRHEIHPLVHAVLPLEQARRAHELLEARLAIGKVFLRPEHQLNPTG